MRVLKNKSKYIIISTLLFQTTIIFINSILVSNLNSLSELKKSIPLINILFLTASILAIFVFVSIRKLSYYEKKEIELKLVKSNMENVEELITLLKTQRHDYLKHIQSIGALLYLEEYKELSCYIHGISKEYRFTSEIVRLGNTALTALINTKREIAIEKGIFFNIECKQKIGNIKIESWELCSLFSNLIGNAIEAVSMMDNEKWVRISTDYNDRNYIFEIENKGFINEKIIEKLFHPGITSNDSNKRGYGLYISKKIVNKYKGNIDVKNTNYGTVLTTIVLPQNVGHYNEKAS